MQKCHEIYSGKAKSVYSTDNPKYLVLHFRNDATAYNAKKHASLAGKGRINNLINAHLMEYLEEHGVPTHFEKLLSDDECLVKSLTMIPVECVVRNYSAGSLSTRLGMDEGLALEEPILEFFYKDDSLQDPMVNEEHIRVLKWATRDEIAQMKGLAFKVNETLKPLFLSVGLLLVDYKLEFGRMDGKLYLGDEFTPDGCRLWDAETLNKMDKDRFRRDLGGVVEAYQEVATRLGVEF